MFCNKSTFEGLRIISRFCYLGWTRNDLTLRIAFLRFYSLMIFYFVVTNVCWTLAFGCVNKAYGSVWLHQGAWLKAYGCTRMLTEASSPYFWARPYSWAEPYAWAQLYSEAQPYSWAPFYARAPPYSRAVSLSAVYGWKGSPQILEPIWASKRNCRINKDLPKSQNQDVLYKLRTVHIVRSV